ncbi:type I secretion system permease/ATPase [Kushneria aurantia]|uniref:Type I secretion system permease/ATPase n=1 Tax=Kushneria aurantia TaxID=504092 RepID=A0ABV6G8I6_9GAMM|nr:type I secretion system permease/ATPase [Kushneria aurantia]
MSEEVNTENASAPSSDELLSCLQVICHQHGHEVTRDHLLSGVPLEAGCLTPGTFVRAAERADLSARHARCSLAAINPALLPAVLLLEPGRACVLAGVDAENGTASVIFPELDDAATEMSLEALNGVYSGRAIYVRPRYRMDARSEHAKRRRVRHWFWDAIRDNRRLYRDVIIASVVINIFAVAMPLFVMTVYDRVVPNLATDTLWVLATGVGVVLIGDLILRLMRSSFIDLAASRADVRISSTIMSRVLDMRMEQRPASTGSFVSSLQAFESVRGFIGSATVVALADLPFALLFVAVVALIGPPLVIPLVVGIVFMMIFALMAQRRLHTLTETSLRASAQRSGDLVEAVSNLETVKALRAESRLQRSWEKATAFLSRTSAQTRMASSSVSSVAMWSQQTVSVVVIIIGVYMILDGNLTQGGLIAAYMLSSRAMAPISQSAAILTQYQHAAAALENLDNLMKLPGENDRTRAEVDHPVVRGDIRFRHVGLRYPDEERDALSDIDISITAGEKVALLGQVGSGKSSLNKLLLGLYQPTSGTVMVDGIDIAQFDPRQLRRQIGYVPQEIKLFYGSLRDNVVMGGGSDGIDSQMLDRALTLSGLKPMVDAHPRGLDWPVGEMGNQLSGGQRQAVGIARAVVHNPQILLFDEPSSAMDYASEEAFKRRLTEYAEGRTLLLVTHRTSLLSLVDRIVVVDGGRVVADGARDTVIEALRSGQIGKASS